jgi:molybdenum cofactor guanylyltransferase
MMTYGLSDKPIGVILAGGRSRRMFGAGLDGDKTLLNLGDRPMLGHVIDRIGPQVSHLILNANGDAARFAAFDVTVTGDTIEGYQGPLAGVLAGMRWAQSQAPGLSHIATVSGDTPFLPPDLVRRLGQHLNATDQLVLASSDSGDQYVTGLWPIALADQLERDLRAGERKAKTWTEAHGAIHVQFPAQRIADDWVDPFFNINSPDDLQRAEAWVRASVISPPLFAIVGWKNSGKTTLLVRLIEHLVKRGYRVASVKCSHHDFDRPGPRSAITLRDTERHQAAGACQVGFIGDKVFGSLDQSGALGNTRPVSGDRLRDLQTLVADFHSVDVVLVEGFKTAPFAKIEVRSGDAIKQPSVLAGDPYVVAIATDTPAGTMIPPQLLRDDIAQLGDIIVTTLGLRSAKGRA